MSKKAISSSSLVQSIVADVLKHQPDELMGSFIEDERFGELIKLVRAEGPADRFLSPQEHLRLGAIVDRAIGKTGETREAYLKLDNHTNFERSVDCDVAYRLGIELGRRLAGGAR